MYCELNETGLIRVSGSDAASFLQAQFTADVLGMGARETRYAGYCSPKGRLLATLLLWRNEDEFLLQLPASLKAAVRTRLAKYVLRSQVTLTDESERLRLYGIAGTDAERAATVLVGGAPAQAHAVMSRDGVAITRLSSSRSLVMAAAESAGAVNVVLGTRPAPEETWSRGEIEAGVPWIGPQTEDRFVPQMVNLDVLGGVSYQKGCYPGQEIVARMHYLGRLKQRMYRVRFSTAGEPRPGDSLYSPMYGADQACGTLVNVMSADGAHDALAVIQIASARGGAVHWNALDGPLLDFLQLPYPVPE
ncbi:MAG: CAF17-like 4Fe-4S cluster assembly/insertion protein YgfZ [Burkholderiales bacterium]